MDDNQTEQRTKQKRRYTPPTLLEIGLKQYLDNTQAIHDNYGYDIFVKELSKNQNVSALSRMFKVSRPTITHWLEVYAKEQANQAYPIAK